MEKNIDHIIGGYLAGDLSAEDKNWLELEMSKDKQLAEKVSGLLQSHRIEQYLKDRLNMAEKIAFEQSIEDNEALKQKVEDHKKVQWILAQSRRQYFEAIINKAAKEQPKNPKNGRKIVVFLSIAMVVLFLGRLFFYPSGKAVINIGSPSNIEPTNNEGDSTPPKDPIGKESEIEEPIKSKGPKLSPSTKKNTLIPTTATKKDSQIIAFIDQSLTEQYKPISLKGNSGNEAKNWKTAYQKQNFENVISILMPIVDSLEVQDKEARLILGLSYLYQKKPDYAQAISQFDIILLQKSRFQEYARWYKSISLLKEDEKEQAIKVLQEINSFPRHFNKGKAKELLDLVSN